MKKIGELTLPAIMIHYKLTVRKCGIGVRIDIQIHGTEQSPETDPEINSCGQLSFNIVAKAFQWENNKSFQHMFTIGYQCGKK